MKNIINIKTLLFLVAGSVLFPSCKKFLEENPKSNVTVSNFYKTEADAISAVNSVYAYLNSTSTGSTAGVYHSTFWVTAGLASDEMQNNSWLLRNTTSWLLSPIPLRTVRWKRFGPCIIKRSPLLILPSTGFRASA